MQLSRLVYTLVGSLLVPFLMAYLWLRGRRAPAYRDHWLERFWGPAASAGSRAFDSAGPVLWLHAVSVGETQAAVPLLRAWLDAKGPQARVVMTHTTPTGRQTGASLCEDLLSGPDPRLVQCYLPYDLPWANRRFLKWTGAQLGLLMETELWPNLLAQAKQAGLTMVLINARLSARSARQMHRFAWLARPALAQLDLICAQTQDDARRFQQVGYKGQLVVTGSLKFDLSIDESKSALGQQWRSGWSFAQVWLVVSSRDDEEQDLFAAWQRAAADRRLPTNTLLIVVPRHPERFDRVFQLASQLGLQVARRSISQALTVETQVWVGDSLGEMAAYVAASDLALMGGSLKPLGGQNPIEVCAQGRPVFMGPHMFNFHQIARLLKEKGAGVGVGSYDAFVEQASQLAADGQRLALAREQASAFVIEHRGATQRTLQALLGLGSSRV
ncbi:MAG: 3-deoxy-D-manno-octulosonic acid transferase [Burkholderiaceae bacterium]